MNKQKQFYQELSPLKAYHFLLKLIYLRQNVRKGSLTLLSLQTMQVPLQTVQIQMRRLVISHHLIRIYTVYHSVFFFFFFYWNPYLQQWMCPNSEMKESISDTQGWND